MVTSDVVKKAAKKLGADLCGIASVDRFTGAPEGFKPTDIYPACKSVIVVAKRVPPALFQSKSPSPYTMVAEIERMHTVDTLSVELCNWLCDHGVNAMPVPADAPYDYWDAERKRGMGVLSMRHAAQCAGLGRIGKNTLVVNEKYGNLLNFGAALADAPLQADPMIEKSYCPKNCRICLKACPAGALDGDTVDQKKCREHTFYPNARGYDIVWCHTCRSSCPNAPGVKRSKSTK
jgi:epoxyqueuosine reductase QueG